MSESTVHLLGWVLITAMWAFVLVGGWRTLREIRRHFRNRVRVSRPAASHRWAANA